jgi:hypothetical protein
MNEMLRDGSELAASALSASSGTFANAEVARDEAGLGLVVIGCVATRVSCSAQGLGSSSSLTLGRLN